MIDGRHLVLPHGNKLMTMILRTFTDVELDSSRQVQWIIKCSVVHKIEIKIENSGLSSVIIIDLSTQYRQVVDCSPEILVEVDSSIDYDSIRRLRYFYVLCITHVQVAPVVQFVTSKPSDVGT